METRIGHNQLTINSNNCEDKSCGRGVGGLFIFALTKLQAAEAEYCVELLAEL